MVNRSPIQRQAASNPVAKLWRQFTAHRDQESRNALLEFYLPLARIAAEHFHAQLPKQVSLDDLVSAAMFGLIDVVGAFDPGHGVRLVAA